MKLTQLSCHDKIKGILSYADGGATRTAVCFSYLRFYIFIGYGVTFPILGQVKEERGLLDPVCFAEK